MAGMPKTPELRAAIQALRDEQAARRAHESARPRRQISAEGRDRMSAHPPREPLILWLTVAFALGVLVMDIARDYRDAPEAVEQIERANEVRT